MNIAEFIVEYGVAIVMIVLIGLVVMVGFSQIGKIDSNVVNCNNTCISNSLEYYQVTYSAYANTVCYCRDIDGRISTRLI